MIRTFLSVLKWESDNPTADAARRRHPRRENDRCVSMIGSKMYPVEDWSFGGMKIVGDGRIFSNDQELPVTLKFKLRGDVIDVNHRARVVRRTPDAIAFEFLPLPQGTRTRFQQVIDDAVSRQFAESQMA